MKHLFKIKSLFCFSILVILSMTAPVFTQEVFNKKNIENFITMPMARQSNDYTCGAAVAVSLLAYNGDTSLEIENAKGLNTNPSIGTDFRQMTQFFKSKGYQVTAHENMTIAELQNYIFQGKPVVCLIQAWEDDVPDYTNYWGIGHYVIAIGYDDQRVYFMDPWVFGSYVYIPKQEFDNRWHQFTADKIQLNHWGMVVTKEQQPLPVYNPDTIIYMQ